MENLLFLGVPIFKHIRVYSKLEDSVLCGNLETELKCKKREYFFYVQPSVSWPNMHSCFSCCSPDISMEKI